MKTPLVAVAALLLPVSLAAESAQNPQAEQEASFDCSELLNPYQKEVLQSRKYKRPELYNEKSCRVFAKGLPTEPGAKVEIRAHSAMMLTGQQVAEAVVIYERWEREPGAVKSKPKKDRDREVARMLEYLSPEAVETLQQRVDNPKAAARGAAGGSKDRTEEVERRIEEATEAKKGLKTGEPPAAPPGGPRKPTSKGRKIVQDALDEFCKIWKCKPKAQRKAP